MKIFYLLLFTYFFTAQPMALNELVHPYDIKINLAQQLPSIKNLEDFKLKQLEQLQKKIPVKNLASIGIVHFVIEVNTTLIKTIQAHDETALCKLIQAHPKTITTYPLDTFYNTLEDYALRFNLPKTKILLNINN